MNPNRDYQIRNDQIFDVIVRSYIDTAEPVGSRTISRRHGVGLSPASIRNIMADLEEQGFLRQPHTSAGRVPTDKGYRYWLDSLMRHEELSEAEKHRVRSAVERAKTLEGLAERVSKLISELTENAALTYIRSMKRVSFLTKLLEELRAIENLDDLFEEEAGFFLEGASRFFEQPEFRDFDKLRTVLRAFEDKDPLIAALGRDLRDEADAVRVHIGRENPADELADVSLVIKDCFLGDTAIGGIAVIGPTRMHYAKVVAVVDFVADTVSERMDRF